MLNIVSEVSASKCSSCINLSAIFIPWCPCIFLKSYGTKDLENNCRCFSSVCLLTKKKKPFYKTKLYNQLFSFSSDKGNDPDKSEFTKKYTIDLWSNHTRDNFALIVLYIFDWALFSSTLFKCEFIVLCLPAQSHTKDQNFTDPKPHVAVDNKCQQELSPTSLLAFSSSSVRFFDASNCFRTCTKAKRNKARFSACAVCFMNFSDLKKWNNQFHEVGPQQKGQFDLEAFRDTLLRPSSTCPPRHYVFYKAKSLMIR